MKKFKICPTCGTRNEPTAIECEECEANISTVRVMDEETIKSVQEQDDQAITATTPMTRTRICEECGFRNPSNARKCQKCGEDISDILPVEAASADHLHFILTSLDGEYAYQIPDGKTLIGREAAMSDYLAKKSFVSRKHAQLNLENGKASIENISQTNYTYINNEKITNGFKELHDGDIIGLGGNEKNGKRQEEAAYFSVRIHS
jgi:ribosomal protein L40E